MKLSLEQALIELESGHDLAHYAALEAAKTLAQNWRDAMRDGTKLENMLSDISDTIKALREFHENLQQF